METNFKSGGQRTNIDEKQETEGDRRNATENRRKVMLQEEDSKGNTRTEETNGNRQTVDHLPV